MSTSHTAETLSIEGPDATAFAQSQFSSNLAALPPGRWQFSAWLDAQGRVRNLFHLARLDQQHLLLLLRGGKAQAMADALQRYVFRSRVRLTPATGRLGCAAALPLFETDRDGAGIRLGCDDHSLEINTASGDDAWCLPQLRRGWAWLPDAAMDALLPPALSLYRLQAIALDKGCYPGQEIVARLHYRGGHKRHLHRVLLAPAAGDATPALDDTQAVHWLQRAAHDGQVETLVVMPDSLADRLTRLPGDARPRIVESWPD